MKDSKSKEEFPLVEEVVEWDGIPLPTEEEVLEWDGIPLPTEDDFGHLLSRMERFCY